MIDRPEIRIRSYFEPDGGDTRWASVEVVEDHKYRIADVSLARGQEHWLAAALFELVRLGAVDVRRVRHWFELCEKGDGPRPTR